MGRGEVITTGSSVEARATLTDHTPILMLQNRQHNAKDHRTHHHTIQIFLRIYKRKLASDNAVKNSLLIDVKKVVKSCKDYHKNFLFRVSHMITAHAVGIVVLESFKIIQNTKP